MNKKNARLKRARRFRAQNRRLGAPRLVVYRTPQHIYAQVVVCTDGQSQVVASASTLDKALRTELSGDKSQKARMIGTVIAERAQAAGIKKLAFDRSGFKYQGRVSALADGARAAGLDF